MPAFHSKEVKYKENTMRILTAMSGGVDSSVAAALLVREGHSVAGATLKLLPEDIADNSREIADAAEVCAQLGIDHYIIDGREAFSHEVMNVFAHDYAEGLTPNPCLVCNKKIKFGLLADWAEENGFNAVATGHYARVDTFDGRARLLRAVDPAKDQSYVLYSLSQSRLSRALFPLGHFTKAEVRSFAEEFGLHLSKKPDSQDICFVKNGSYAALVEKLAGKQEGGEIVDLSGAVAGRHEGVIHYTIGQRKGIGGFGKPMYVLSKDADTRRVTVAPDEALYTREVMVRDINWIAPAPDASIRVTVKLRYSHKGSAGLLAPGGTSILFDEPQRAVTPGQAAVWYDGDEVLGGGVIV